MRRWAVLGALAAVACESAPPKPAAPAPSASVAEPTQSCAVRARAMSKRLGSKETNWGAPKGTPRWAVDELIRARKTREPDTKALIIARALERAITDCEPLAEMFRRTGNLVPGEKRAALLEGAPRGLVKCQCSGVDVLAFEVFLRLALEQTVPAAPVPSSSASGG